MPEGASTSEESKSVQFLFKDGDFESDTFHAASFVAKYRRATSLESLRSQLRLYCESLKEQLYDIINRDYKDFITIATKLDGVDNRVEHLRKPLVELRMDLTVLNDTLVSNLQVIGSKLQERQEISYRRRLIESSLACMEKLSNVENVLNYKVPAPKREAGEGEMVSRQSFKQLSRGALIQISESQGSGNSNPELAELRQCSELERASVALAEALSHLSQEKNEQYPSTLKFSPPKSLIAMRRSLDLRAHSIKDSLLGRLQICCKVVLGGLCNENAVAMKDDSDNLRIELSSHRRRSLGHLLRALVALGSGVIVEELLAEMFTIPAIKSTLTQGRIDGSQGRGSFSGLKESLDSIFNQLRCRVSDVLVLGEEIFSFSSLNSGQQGSIQLPIDLVVNGAWTHILASLMSSYPAMFSSGIANVFHLCYTASNDFIDSFSYICGKKWSKPIFYRLINDDSFIKFKSMWKLDVYYQLRAQEILSRLDRAIMLTSEHGISSQVFDDIYVTPTDSDKSSQYASASWRLSVQAKELLEFKRAVEKVQSAVTHENFTWKLSFTETFVCEMLTCLHPSIFLRDLNRKFLSLIVKILNGYFSHLAKFLDQRCQEQSIGSPSPSKGFVSVVASRSMSLEELMWVDHDICQLNGWIKTVLIPFTTNKLSFQYQGEQGESAAIISSMLETLLKRQQNTAQELRPNVRKKIADIITMDCKSGLKAVKSIAGKFRMTNKPPPESPSSYVASILKPLKKYLENYKELVDADNLVAWKDGIIDSVTTSYHQNIRDLLATAKQMDTALQRRSKAGRKTASSSTDPGTQMTDSEKIALQIHLDAMSYGDDVKEICGRDPKNIISFKKLLDEVASAQSTVET